VLAAKYNVTAGDLKALKTAIADFTEAQPKPRQSRSAKASATAELVDLFDQLDQVLNDRLDPLIQKYQRTNPGFYSQYGTARVIVDEVASREVKGKAPQPTLAKAA
jgi:hypothetical protein